MDDASLKKIVKEGIIKRSKRIQSEFQKYNLPFFDMSKDFPAKIEDVLHFLKAAS
jgi:hypothetical protein